MLLNQIRKGENKKLCKQSEVRFELKEEPSFVSVVFYRKTIESDEKVPNTDEYRWFIVRRTKNSKFLTK